MASLVSIGTKSADGQTKGSTQAARALAQLRDLPTLPAVAVRLLNLTSNLDSEINDVCDLLKSDQTLTAKLLALASSAHTGRSKPAETVNDAVVALGFNTVRTVVLTLKIFEVFGPRTEADAAGFDRAEFWKHAIGVACTSRRIAQQSPKLKINPAEAFVAGILHDLGKVALDAVFPKAYARAAALANERHTDIADCESEILGLDHTVAGRQLAENWGLPRRYRDVIWLHHLAMESLPGSVEAPGLVALVQLADVLARERRIGYSGNHRIMEPAHTLAEQLALAPDAIGGDAEIVAEVSHWSGLLGLDTSTPEAVYLRALSNANQELAQLHADLASSNTLLAASARYFRALGALDRALKSDSSPADVTAAIVEASTTACQRRQLGVFGLLVDDSTVDVYWRRAASRETERASAPLSADVTDWAADGDASVGSPVIRAPRVVRVMLEPILEQLGEGDVWLWPIAHAGQLLGGVFYLSDVDERKRLAPEENDLRSYLTSLGLALGRAQAHAAAQRLSDDLAENNRRLRIMQAEVLRSRTLASITELAAGAGHELNSPLAVISGRAQMLQSQAGDPETQRTLGMITEKAHECSRIVKELMEFAKPRPIQASAVDLRSLLGELREAWLAQTERTPNQITLELAENLPLVHADRDQLATALNEVLRNASQAIPADSGKVAVTARLGAAGDMAEVIVRDNGEGLNQAVLNRAFDPFFSHRAAGRGRGLGLPRAYRIVDGHGGRIWLESREGQGTAAHIVLPLAKPAE